MERLHFNGPGFRYLVKWRRKGSIAWDSITVEDPLQTVFQQEVTDVYELYEVQVKAQNDMGVSHQPAFIYIGRSGESGNVCVCGWVVVCVCECVCCLSFFLLSFFLSFLFYFSFFLFSSNCVCVCV
jgi:hypothetical protein